MSTPLELFQQAAALQVPSQQPAVIWAVAPWFLGRNGVTARDYYTNKETQFRVQSLLQKTYPDTLLLPGFYPDFGLAAEASGFGCELEWGELTAPVPKSRFQNISEIRTMKPIDVRRDGLFPEIIERYHYLMDHIDPSYAAKFGYLDGTAQPLGPIELAAAMVGYNNMLYETYDHPDELHLLLRIVTDTLIEWLHEVERHVGKLKRLIVQDHFACQVSAEMCEEFVFPYLRRMFAEFPDAIRMWHNEGNVRHVLSDIPSLGMEVFHTGMDLEETKRAIGNQVCLMGNLNTSSLMMLSSAEAVREAAQQACEIGAPGGGFILTSAGAVGDATPHENILAMLETARQFDLGKKERK